MNSLKFFTIKESIYTLTQDEKEELIKEAFSFLEDKSKIVKKELELLGDNELTETFDEIDKIKNDRLDRARENYYKKFYELLNIPEEGRDFNFSYPNSSNFYVQWNYKGDEYSYIIELNLIKNSFQIEKSLICSCFSPIGCSGCNDLLDKNSIEGIYAHGVIEDIEDVTINHEFLKKNYGEAKDTIEKWIHYVLKLYLPVMKEYENLKIEYFNILNGK
jgi:hypothetical protein